jgi:cbb3-type cytochrome oxidase subunit 3
MTDNIEEGKIPSLTNLQNGDRSNALVRFFGSFRNGGVNWNRLRNIAYGFGLIHLIFITYQVVTTQGKGWGAIFSVKAILSFCKDVLYRVIRDFIFQWFLMAIFAYFVASKLMKRR